MNRRRYLIIGSVVVLFTLIFFAVRAVLVKPQSSNVISNTDNKENTQNTVDTAQTSSQTEDISTNVELLKEPRPDPLPEDKDRDGISNADEQKMGLSDTVFDTDSDGVSDGEELRIGIDPKKADTDGDGFSDGWELLNGFSPTSTQKK